MSVIFFLIKFFNSADHATDFVNGKIFANSLATFKSLEVTDESGRGDRHEGTIAWLQPDQGRLEMNGMDLSDDLAGPIQLQRNWLNLLHIFCLHAVHSGALDIASLSNENVEELRSEFMVPDSCSSLGEHAVIVKDVRGFIKRMKSAARANGYEITHRSVRYYDPESFHGIFRDIESVFWKQDRHSDQREFRFVIDNGSKCDTPLIMEIGDISDITMQFRSSELNSEKFLGGDLTVPE